MGARQVVLLTPSKFLHPIQLLSRQQSVSVSPLAATLMNLLASVANKRLTARLNPLAATLTKNRGVGAPPFDASMRFLHPGRYCGTFSAHDSGADESRNALPSAAQIRR